MIKDCLNSLLNLQSNKKKLDQILVKSLLQIKEKR